VYRGVVGFDVFQVSLVAEWAKLGFGFKGEYRPDAFPNSCAGGISLGQANGYAVRSSHDTNCLVAQWRQTGVRMHV